MIPTGRLIAISAKLFREFIRSEQSGGVVLIVSALVALAIANSPTMSPITIF